MSTLKNIAVALVIISGISVFFFALASIDMTKTRDNKELKQMMQDDLDRYLEYKAFSDSVNNAFSDSITIVK